MAAQRATNTTGAAKKTAAKKTAAKKAPSKRTAKKAEPENTPAKVPQPTAGQDEPGLSLMMIKVGGHEYPRFTSSVCRTCQSPHRRWIENEMIRARSYNSVATALREMPVGNLPHPSADAIADHVNNGHMPSVAHVRRELIDREAKRMGQAFSEGTSLVTYKLANEQIIQRGYERLMQGEIDVSTTDLLGAIGSQQRIEASLSSEGFDLEAMQATLMVYLEIAQEFIPRERMGEYGRKISQHPIIRALSAQMMAERNEGGESVQQTA